MEKRIKMFIKSPETRIDKIKIKNKDGKMVPIPWFSETLKRETTWLDVIYIMMDIIVADKHVYTTRYPIEHFQKYFPI